MCRVFIQRCCCSSIKCLSIVNSTNQTFLKHTSQDTSSTTDSKASYFTAFTKFFTDEFRHSQWSTTSAQLEYETVFNDTSLVKEFTCQFSNFDLDRVFSETYRTRSDTFWITNAFNLNNIIYISLRNCIVVYIVN